MNRICTFLLAIMVFAQGVSALWICLAFHANRTSIATVLCAQRAVKENTCQGQCVLMKKLKQRQEQEQQNPDTKLQEMTWSFRSLSGCAIAKNNVVVRKGLHPTGIRPNHYVHNRIHAIFHPPRTAV